MQNLNHFLYKPYFQFIFPVFLILFIYLTNTIPFHFILNNPMNIDGWKTVMIKSNNLFSNLSHLDPSSHNAKTVFRLTIPLLVKCFRINFQNLIIIQFVSYYFFIFFLNRILFKYFDSIRISYLLLITICTTYFGKAFIVDFRWFDGWAYFFIVLALYSRFNILVIIFVLFGIFTDERVILSLPAIFLLKNKNIDFESMKFKFNIDSLVIVFSFVLYFLIRVFLSLKFNMKMPVDLIGSPIIDNVNKRLIGPGFFTFFEGLWIFILLAIYKIYNLGKMNFLFIIFFIVFFISCILVFSVYDVTRSGAYLMPYVLIFIKILYKNLSKIEFKSYLNSAFLVSVFFPGIYVISGVGMNNFILNDYLFVLLNRISF
jgi:hypothetical protein